LRTRLATRDLTLDLSNPALAYLTAEGYDVAYGARPLKRAIQQLLENPLSIEILEGKFMPGDIIEVKVTKEEGLFFKKKR